MLNTEPEILAPVANLEMCQAAVHNGADAIYVGMPGFNARGRSADLSISELKALIDFCRQYGVKVFIACNILVFENEISQLAQLLRSLILLGVDAFIVQDLGIVRLIKQLAPWQHVHASTQMTITNAEAIELLEPLKIERFVLGRENSITELEKIRVATSKELEVFVHGALCVSYSGQCLTSESNSSRSANRGQCNQSCRYPYELIVDGEVRSMGEKRHLVSPQDLYGLEDIDKLIKIGIDSFKIEGRLKAAEYVASTVRNYCEVRDSVIKQKQILDFSQRREELGIAFARGNFNGWYDGVNHQQLVDARFSKPRGHELGKVLKVDASGVEIECDRSLAAGDGLVFHDFSKGIEIGGYIFSLHSLKKGVLKLKFGRDFSIQSISLGMRVFFNSSVSFDKRQRQSFYDKARLRKVPVKGVLQAELDKPIHFRLSDDRGNTVSVYSEVPLVAARSQSLTHKSAFAELSSLSATIFNMIDLQFKVQGQGFIHNRQLKYLRQQACEKLLMLRTAVNVPKLPELSELQDWKNKICAVSSNESTKETCISVLIREEAQLEALDGLGIDCVYLDYEFNKLYEKSLARVRSMGFKCGIASTRILKPQELGHLKYIERLKPDCILVRNLGALKFLQSRGIELIGDFSLNVTNSLSASWLLTQGLTRITAAYDLNQAQLSSLLENVRPSKCEVTIHQYMPSFHMEHCVFAAFLSKGSSFKDCGKPCEKYKVALRDQSGVSHPLKADAECRNTMFQGKAQSALRLLPVFKQKGVGFVRIEALFENAESLRGKLSIYLAAMREEMAVNQKLDELGAFEKFGVSEGQLFNKQEYKSRKKELLQVIHG